MRAASVGSPPRVRGEAIGQIIHRLPARITPACAGRSDIFSIVYGGKKDHPRVCGEKAVFKDLKRVAKGSPPRVRGEVEKW